MNKHTLIRYSPWAKINAIGTSHTRPASLNFLLDIPHLSRLSLLPIGHPTLGSPLSASYWTSQTLPAYLSFLLDGQRGLWIALLSGWIQIVFSFKSSGRWYRRRAVQMSIADGPVNSGPCGGSFEHKVMARHLATEAVSSAEPALCCCVESPLGHRSTIAARGIGAGQSNQ